MDLIGFFLALIFQSEYPIRILTAAAAAATAGDDDAWKLCNCCWTGGDRRSPVQGQEAGETQAHYCSLRVLS
eukprot:1138608-Pelagomonas_calceolata.AAC.1